MRNSILFFLISFFISHSFAAKSGQPYFDHKTVDLAELLPPPPDKDSNQTKSELAEVLSIQTTRTAQQIASAQEDSAENIWRFSNVVNDSKFTEKDLPKFSHFFVDHDLGGSVTGLELIQNFNLASRATLVTSRWDDCDVQSSAKEIGVRILPKFLIGDMLL